MIKCLDYLAPTLDSTHQVSDDLHAAGVKDFFLHVVAKDESSLSRQRIHSSNYLDRKMMGARYPEARLAAVGRHFIIPFRALEAEPQNS